MGLPPLTEISLCGPFHNVFLQASDSDLLQKQQFYNNPLSDPKMLSVHNVCTLFLVMVLVKYA
jgi:hypothetical protein